MSGIQNSTGYYAAVLSEMKQGNMVTSKTSKSSREKNTGKKKLNYNHRDVSSQLLRATRAQSVSSVLVRAKNKLVVLQHCKGTGEYDEKALSDAVTHAKKIVKCAQLKVRHLKEEEQLKERNKRAQEAAQEEIRKKELMEKRKWNRNEERGKVHEADLSYQREQEIDLGLSMNTDMPQMVMPEGGVILELSAVVAEGT